jgi:hypothetical protein
LPRLEAGMGRPINRLRVGVRSSWDTMRGWLRILSTGVGCSDDEWSFQYRVVVSSCAPAVGGDVMNIVRLE